MDGRFSNDLDELLKLGFERVARWCDANRVPPPCLQTYSKEDWQFDPCAYYRPATIHICLPKCQRPCGKEPSRLWSWPGSTVDRTPYGVAAHELGHHVDWYTGVKKGKYYSEYCEVVMAQSGESPLTSYAPNPAEWFAEMFRLFVTNPGLLQRVKPKTFGILIQRWKPVPPVNHISWRYCLGSNVPYRVVKAQLNKFIQ